MPPEGTGRAGTLIDPLLLIGPPLSVRSTRKPVAISQILSFSN